MILLEKLTESSKEVGMLLFYYSDNLKEWFLRRGNEDDVKMKDQGKQIYNL